MPSSPSGYTTNYQLKLWADHDDPGASQLNANWQDIDTILHRIVVKKICTVTFQGAEETSINLSTLGSPFVGASILNIVVSQSGNTLSTISGGVNGMVLTIIASNASQESLIIDMTGNIVLTPGKSSVTLYGNQMINLMYLSQFSKWYEVGYSS